jgi:restriction system protein
MGPLLDCLRTVGGSARPKEVLPWIRARANLPAETLDIPLKSGQSRFYNQVHWARQYLVWEGMLDDTVRGTWKLTPSGWKTHLDDEAAADIVRRHVKISRAAQKATDTGEVKAPEDQDLLPPTIRARRRKSPGCAQKPIAARL